MSISAGTGSRTCKFTVSRRPGPGASSHQAGEKHEKIGRTRRPQLAWASFVFLLSCSFYFLHCVIQDFGSDQSITKEL